MIAVNSKYIQRCPLIACPEKMARAEGPSDRHTSASLLAVQQWLRVPLAVCLALCERWAAGPTLTYDTIVRKWPSTNT